MSSPVMKPMNASDFLSWAEGRPGRWELHERAVIAMSPERIAHVRAKGAAFRALAEAIRRSGQSCEAFSDGISIRVGDGSVYEPDALVHCGPRLSEDAIEIENPVVVVEVQSASTAARDHGVKLAGYFSLPGTMHYLIVDPDRRVVIHHKRGAGEIIETRIVSSDLLRLDPPGIAAVVAEFFPPPASPGAQSDR